jgi:catechol 2,3-dioxygenase-like lactoylglutathione lyase family enzyme
MARVTGIGGIFFRARDPQALADWYRLHLGITQPDIAVWRQEAGPTILSPFATDTDYFPADRQWMLNLRVDDLPALIARLRADGLAVETRPDWDGDGSHGTFARIHDPEGLAIELWQPPA